MSLGRQQVFVLSSAHDTYAEPYNSSTNWYTSNKVPATQWILEAAGQRTRVLYEM